MGACKDVFFSDEKMLLYIDVFLWKKSKKKHDLKHHVEHDGFRYFSMPLAQAKKKCRAETRKANILKLSCVMCHDQKLLQLSWMDGLCRPKFSYVFPNCVILFWKKVISSCTSWGVCLVRKPFYWLLQSKEKPQVMVVYDIVYGGFWKLISLSSLRKCIFWCSLFCVTAVSNCDLDCWAKDHKTFGPVLKGLPRTVAKDFGPQ